MHTSWAESRSIRPFIGAKNYDLSRQFYQELGFEEIPVGHDMTLFKVHTGMGFYLQAYYVQDWIDNTMILLEVTDLDSMWAFVKEKRLDEKYSGVRLSVIHDNDWGREFFLHDPSGVLWHIATFSD